MGQQLEAWGHRAGERFLVPPEVMGVDPRAPTSTPLALHSLIRQGGRRWWECPISFHWNQPAFPSQIPKKGTDPKSNSVEFQKGPGRAVLHSPCWGPDGIFKLGCPQASKGFPYLKTFSFCGTNISFLPSLPEPWLQEPLSPTLGLRIPKAAATTSADAPCASPACGWAGARVSESHLHINWSPLSWGVGEAGRRERCCLLPGN